MSSPASTTPVTKDPVRAILGLSAAWIVVILLWWVLGFAGLIMSSYCFDYSGSVGQKMLGLVLAIFYGPFYWIYFLFDTGYCRPKTIFTA